MLFAIWKAAAGFAASMFDDNADMHTGKHGGKPLE